MWCVCHGQTDWLRLAIVLREEQAPPLPRFRDFLRQTISLVGADDRFSSSPPGAAATGTALLFAQDRSETGSGEDQKAKGEGEQGSSLPLLG